MGRGQRISEGETTRGSLGARSLLYGRQQRGQGPVTVPELSEWQKLSHFAKLTAFQLSGDGYIKGVDHRQQNADLDSSREGPIFFDIHSRDGQSVTRIEVKRESGLNGLVISDQDSKSRPLEEGDHLITFHTGKLDAFEHYKLEADLIDKGRGIGLNFIERELIWPELKRKLDSGQTLELVCGRESSFKESHQFLVDLVDRTAVDQQDADKLIYDLGCVPLGRPEGLLETMHASPLGQDLLAGRGLWRTRRCCDK